MKLPPGPTSEQTAGQLRWRRALWWATALLLLAAVTALVAVGANGPEDPRLEGALGFGQVAFRVTPPASAVLPPSGQLCALLADTDELRARGLMGRHDLAGYDAMVFRFDQDTTSPFFMRNVPVALSVAWFDAGGRFVSAADMQPCPDQDGCPLYQPAGPYRLAMEVLGGGLTRLGVQEGSRVAVGGSCTR